MKRQAMRNVDELFPEGDPAGPVFTLEKWGSGDGWRRFIFPAELGRNFVQNLSIRNPRGRIYSVMHCDLECRFSTPPRTARSEGFYSFPWINPDSAFAMGVHHTEAERRKEFQALETDLGAGDLAGGNAAARLDRLLRALGREAGRHDLILLNLTCLPAKTGDAARVPAMVARSGIRAQVLYNDPDVDQSVPPILRMIRKRVEKAMKKPGRRLRPRTVNLIGFPRSIEKTELENLLAELGIRVNVDLIPHVDLGAVEDLFAAPVTLFFPEAHYRSLYRQLLGGTGLMGLAPTPFGLEGSRAWLGEVGAAFGLRRGFEKLWRDWWSRRRKEWKELAAEAARHGVGFIGTEGELAALADPMQAAGVPIFSMLREMGFGIRHFVFREGEGKAGTRLPDAVEFKTPAGLDAALRKSTCRLAYSDVRSDRRLARSGKLALSAAHFRMGPEGCLRTLRFLAAACRFDLFLRYPDFIDAREDVP